MRIQTKQIDWFELALLAAFAVVSLWVLGLDLWQVLAHGRVWTGADSVYGVDQYQYMAWIRDASRHGLVANLFVLHPTRAIYFQPAIVVSGGLAALGLAPWLTLLLWKPVAVAAVFLAARGYVHRSLEDRGARRAALALALFFGSFTVLYGSSGTIGDLFPGFLSWGYPFALMGLAAMVGGLLAYNRARTARTFAWSPGLLGAAASALHPWHGALLIAAVVGAEALIPRDRRLTGRNLVQPAGTVALTAIPLVYYVLLGHIDPSWDLARAASKHAFPLGAIVLELVPLLVPGLLAYRERPRTFLAATSLVWPVAAFAIFAISTTGYAATPLHAFQGITIPLSVLAIRGVRRTGLARLPHSAVWASAVVVALTVPATVWQLNTARRMVRPQSGDSNFITHSERRALNYLAHDPRPGGVITRLYLGQLVPGFTGRRTFVGDCLWSQPGCRARLGAVRTLFDGSLNPAAAKRFVLDRDAGFVLTDCRQDIDLGRTLGPIITAVHRFGCAAVYDVQ